VVNKVDKPGANPDKVVNAAFDLFDKLGATDEQLDFPVVYASGINGWSSLEEGAPGEQWGPDMSALFNTILKHVPSQNLVTRRLPCSCKSLRWTFPRSLAASAWAASARARSSPMHGRGGHGRAGWQDGQRPCQPGADLPRPGPHAKPTEAGPGEIVLINGIEDIGIGVTVTDPANPHATCPCSRWTSLP